MTPILLLLSNLVLVLAFGGLVMACLRLRGLLPYLLGLYVVAYADIVLILQAASLMGALSWLAVLSLQVLLTASAVALWIGVGRPQLMRPFWEFRLSRLALDRQRPYKLISLALLTVAVGYVYLLHAKLILAVVPDNYDALTYHLARVGYWLQYHSLYPWPTPDPRQTTFPMNAELGLLWTILWWGSDRLSGFVQWVTVPVIMLGIYGLTRLLGYSRWQAAMTALLWATLTQVLFQSSTAQNDLVTTSFWVATVYFFFSGNQQRTRGAVLLSGLAFGLAIGTKGTSLFVLPGLGLALIVVFTMRHSSREFRNYLFRWSAACMLGFALFGSFTYVQNTVAFGNPLGASTPRTGAMVLDAEEGVAAYEGRLRDNLGRYTYQFVDFSGLPFQLASVVNPLKAAVFSRIYGWLGISVGNPGTIGLSSFDLRYINPLDENSSWFGPLAILLIAAAIAQAYQGARRREPLRLSMLIFGLGFLVVQGATQTWTPFKGRYYLIPMAISFPLMACLLETRAVWHAIVSSCLVLLGFTAMFTVTQQAGVLQGIGWGQAFAPERRDPSWADEFNFRLIMKDVPMGATVGLTGGDDFRDYPFFGEHFTRPVTLEVPDNGSILPRTDVSRFVKDFQDSEYLFLTPDSSPATQDFAPQQFSLLSNDGANSLWIRNDLRGPNDCDGKAWPFTEIFSSSTVAVCPRFPVYPGLTMGGNSRTIMLRDGHFQPTIAPGSQGQLGFDLLAKEPIQVVLSVQVVPRQLEGRQTLQLSLAAPGSQPQVLSASFSGKKDVGFGLSLVPGTYRIKLGLADGSTEASILKITVATP